jgi:hypothetical protein
MLKVTGISENTVLIKSGYMYISNALVRHNLYHRPHNSAVTKPTSFPTLHNFRNFEERVPTVSTNCATQTLLNLSSEIGVYGTTSNITADTEI